ncbi:MAG: hypothetical protein ACKVYV_05090, partial [Limisphaerales bacterium]
MTKAQGTSPQAGQQAGKPAEEKASRRAGRQGSRPARTGWPAGLLACTCGLGTWLPTFLLLLFTLDLPAAQPPALDPPRWWKGNLHTHSFWSDGDDFP